jgi:Asp-tRNA(Asn)/Glu-tRNA(Gln) amidotransferase A subunit family amidase
MKPHIRQQPNATEIYISIVRREATVEAVTRDAIARIGELEPSLHAWKFLDTSMAIQRALAIDARIAMGESVGQLAGIPLAVKDIMDTADMPTAYGSAVYEGNLPRKDADVVSRVREADAVLFGKTVTTELAYFTPGPTANPWNLAHTPGGSSSGSAAAVASGMVPLGLGSQTAGSLIRPASYCGVFALKPTFDLISGEGVKPFAPSLDTIGWLSNSAEDLELMRSALQGESFERLPDASGMKIASCLTHEWAATDASGFYAWEEAHRRLSATGTSVVELLLPQTLAGLLQAQKTVMAYEAALHLSYEAGGCANMVSSHILDLVAAGKSVPLEDYVSAKRLAEFGRRQVLDLLGDADVILVPAATGEAPKGLSATGDPIFSRVWTLLGMPCTNVPGLSGPAGMPVGMQLVGRPGQERRLLACSASLHNILSAN